MYDQPESRIYPVVNMIFLSKQTQRHILSLLKCPPEVPYVRIWYAIETCTGEKAYYCSTRALQVTAPMLPSALSKRGYHPSWSSSLSCDDVSRLTPYQSFTEGFRDIVPEWMRSFVDLQVSGLLSTQMLFGSCPFCLVFKLLKGPVAGGHGGVNERGTDYP